MNFEFGVIGSCVFDIICHLKNDFKSDKICFKIGSKFEMKNLRFDAGGSGHNVACALGRFGRKVSLLAAIGKDAYGDFLFRNLKKNRVNTIFIQRKDELTGFSLIFLRPDGERSILINRGANLHLEFDKKFAEKNKRLIFTSIVGEKAISTLGKIVRIMKKENKEIIANPSITMIRAHRKELLKILESSSIVIMNYEELKALIGIRDVRMGMRRLSKKTPIVVITMGKKGVIATNGRKIIRKKAFKIKVVDTTGAGDTFAAGFVHWFYKLGELESALDFAQATAALNIMTLGATTDMPSEEDVLKFLREKL